MWWGWSTAQRRWVHFYRVSAQNQLPFRSKGKRENARCLSHWANDCSLADAALHSGLSPPFFLGKKPPRWRSNEQYGQREWQRVHSWGHLPQGSSRSHKTFDVCSPPTTDLNVQEKKIQLFGACVFPPSWTKQEWVRSVYASLCHEGSCWPNAHLLWRIIFDSFIVQETEQALSSTKHTHSAG